MFYALGLEQGNVDSIFPRLLFFLFLLLFLHRFVSGVGDVFIRVVDFGVGFWI